ncbi:hypothetical protein [Acanthopleuribacter pedis]|uniref:Transmembrane protein n=1 Tax=Acanthopleuribacter pedis TaxID=442870 RepID=A0A8J7Q7L9_9BACT|nr:hypothetical protein [Acanthopleuribacter pedis]MBO1318319.1 hypothetical protein [Acanthopleuribacter pedis]
MDETASGVKWWKPVLLTFVLGLAGSLILIIWKNPNGDPIPPECTEWSELSAADCCHCTGDKLDEGVVDNLAQAKSRAEMVNATCLIWQTTKNFAAYDGKRVQGCNGCTARVTHALDRICK